MKEHFKEQLDIVNPLEDPSRMKGKSLYSEYQKGDRVVAFLEQIEETKEPHKHTVLSLIMIAEREFDKLAEEYEFVEMKRVFPVLVKKSG